MKNTTKPQDNTQSIYIARHQQTYWNSQDRIQTHSDHQDTCLTPKGRQDAAVIAEILSYEPIEAIYHSRKARTRETARIINKSLSAQLHEDPRLNDCSLGFLDGLTMDGFRERYSDIYQAREADKFSYRVPDMYPHLACPAPESMQDGLERVSPLIGSIRGSGKETLIVGHRGINRIILYHLLHGSGHDLSREDASRIDVPNFGVYKVTISGASTDVSVNFGDGWNDPGF